MIAENKREKKGMKKKMGNKKSIEKKHLKIKEKIWSDKKRKK